MKFKVDRASDYNYKESVEINTLEELMEFVNKNGSIVIWGDKEKGAYNDHSDITIYDGYLE